MPADTRILPTERLFLRTWEDDDYDSFCELHSDPIVMRDLGGPISREQSARKMDKYRNAFAQFGYSRWCVTDRSGGFLGYVGIMQRGEQHPIGAHDEIGWRLSRNAWGNGYATEAALAALNDCFMRHSLAEVLAYTSADNARPQAVIARLPFERCQSRDFNTGTAGGGSRNVLVWKTDWAGMKENTP